jgi:hypothetical protein
MTFDTFTQYIKTICEEVQIWLNTQKLNDVWFGFVPEKQKESTFETNIQKLRRDVKDNEEQYNKTYSHCNAFFTRQDKMFSNTDDFFTVNIDTFDVNNQGELWKTDEDHKELTVKYTRDDFLNNHLNLRQDIANMIYHSHKKKIHNEPLSNFTYTEWKTKAPTIGEEQKLKEILNKGRAICKNANAIIESALSVKKLPMTKKLKLALEREKIKTPIKKKIVKDTINYDKIFKDGEQIILNAEMIIKSVSGLKYIINPNADQIMSDADMIIKSVSELKPIKLKLEPVQPAKTTQPTRPKGFLQLKPQIRRPLEISFNMPVFKKPTEPTEPTQPTRQTINIEISKILKEEPKEETPDQRLFYQLITDKIDILSTKKNEWETKAKQRAYEKLNKIPHTEPNVIKALGKSPSTLYCEFSKDLFDLYQINKEFLGLPDKKIFSNKIFSIVKEKIPDVTDSLFSNHF